MKSAFLSITSARLWRSSAALCALFLAPALFGADAVFEQVVRQARTAAATPYLPNETVLPEVLQKLDYDTYRLIAFRPGETLWRDDRTRFRVQFFHPGYLYKEPVALNEVVEGEIRPVEFSPKFFRYSHLDPAPLKNAQLGFAGFRLLYPLNQSQPLDEVISFLGSNYFRALGAGTDLRNLRARHRDQHRREDARKNSPPSASSGSAGPPPARASCSSSPTSTARA